MKRINYAQIEIDILQTAASGTIMTPKHESFRELLLRYPADYKQAITCVMISLQAQGFLMSLPDTEGQPARNGWSRGLSPSGYRYLDKMDHPARHWLTSNWFPVTIASINILIGSAALISSTL